MAANWTTLNPKGATYLGRVLTGNQCSVEFRGLWCPGDHHEFWGPEGTSERDLGGHNLWSALAFATVDTEESSWGLSDLPEAISSLTPIDAFIDKIDRVVTDIRVGTSSTRVAAAEAYRGESIILSVHGTVLELSGGIYVVMVDSRFDDNWNHPDTPMQARISGEWSL